MRYGTRIWHGSRSHGYRSVRPQGVRAARATVFDGSVTDRAPKPVPRRRPSSGLRASVFDDSVTDGTPKPVPRRRPSSGLRASVFDDSVSDGGAPDGTRGRPCCSLRAAVFDGSISRRGRPCVESPTMLSPSGFRAPHSRLHSSGGTSWPLDTGTPLRLPRGRRVRAVGRGGPLTMRGLIGSARPAEIRSPHPAEIRSPHPAEIRSPHPAKTVGRNRGRKPWDTVSAPVLSRTPDPPLKCPGHGRPAQRSHTTKEPQR
jgi:hypothetical protein